jgi:Beta-1,3-glucanase
MSPAHRLLAFLISICAALVPLGCSSNPKTAAGTGTGGTTGTGGDSSSGTSSGTTSGTSTGTLMLGDGGAACTGDDDVAGGFPTGFWDSSNIPAATGSMMFKFLNRTNGKYSDAEVYWSFQNTTLAVDETHSLADAPTYDMPAPPAGGGFNGRMYFYICPAGSPAGCAGSNGATDYYDFIEFAFGNNTTGPKYWINYDTTRVDAFGIKLALDLNATTGPDHYVGENCPTFAEDRAATFASYVASVPAEFQPCGQPPNAPYRIKEPGAGCGFNAGGPNADYYNAFEMEMWTNNGITIPMPGPNGSNLAAYPDLSAAIFRHVGSAAGTWTAAGKLVNGSFWSTMPESTFYGAAPADYYAQWIHSRAIHQKQYAFPYDDVGSNSSDVGASGMVYMLVAIGW